MMGEEHMVSVNDIVVKKDQYLAWPKEQLKAHGDIHARLESGIQQDERIARDLLEDYLS
jgi:hypothetical protein